MGKKDKIFQAAKGYFGRRKNCWAVAIRAVHKGWQKAYIGRKLKKRDVRTQWIQQINAGVRLHNISYSKFYNAFSLTGMELNRKVLADLASCEPYSFAAVVQLCKETVPAITAPKVNKRMLFESTRKVTEQLR